MSSPILIGEVFSTEDPLYLPAMELYIESFPRDERYPISYFSQLLRPDASHRHVYGPRYHLLTATLDQELVGMRWMSFHPGVSLGYFVYLVTDARVRGKGVGSRLVQSGILQCQLDAAMLGAHLDAVCFEVERIDQATSADDRIVRESRLAFFEERGAICVSPDYVQPPLSSSRRAVPLNLLAYMVTDRQSLQDIALGFCLECGEYPPGDPAVERTIAAVGQPFK